MKNDVWLAGLALMFAQEVRFLSFMDVLPGSILKSA